MSLFSQLQRLYRPDRFMIEDFHTEIVAQVLRNSPGLTLAWLRAVGVTSLEQAEHIDVFTQKIYEQLPGHATASRPDLVINLVAAAGKELVLIESKLPSKQGIDQLQRYAEHLEAAKQKAALKKASLIFITRDYEAAPDVLMKDPRFTLTRWFHFYQVLKNHSSGDGLAKELKLFMEENRISLGNQFRSTDVVALEELLSAKALMDETIQGEVHSAALRILGHVSNPKRALTELRDYHRYIISSRHGGFTCMIGYWLPHANPDQPVWVGITLESDPRAEFRKDVIDAFRAFSGGTDSVWSADGLDDENAWSSIYSGKTLHALMGGADHVREIKNYFLSALAEVERFRKTFPNLRWGGTVPEESIDEE